MSKQCEWGARMQLPSGEPLLGFYCCVLDAEHPPTSHAIREDSAPAGAKIVGWEHLTPFAQPKPVGESSEFDPVNRPKHYNSHPSGVECITITEHMSFCIGNAIKYLWRAEEKGAAIEDLKKAVWYINREIARREAGSK